MLIDVIAGARPNFMKIAPIIKAIQVKQLQGKNIQFRLVHTGQHYDEKMSNSFFDQLNIPKPDINLGVGSGSQAKQTSAIMIGYENLLQKKKPNICLVVGDVNSTMACAIVAKKECVKVAHVEAGLRSYDMRMPEEINRLVTDTLTDWYFTTSNLAGENLVKSGVDEEKIFFVGNTMIDTLFENLKHLKSPSFWEKSLLKKGKYLLLTLHRPSNVDVKNDLNNILNEVSKAARDLKVIFPAHPRTAGMLKDFYNLPENLIIVDPQPYLEFIFLVKNSLAVVTDSGGITEETTVLGIPCMTLRDSTERPETITMGTNELIGTNLKLMEPYFDRLFKGKWKKGEIPEKWDGKAAMRIVELLPRFGAV